MKIMPKGFIVKGTSAGLYNDKKRLDLGLIYSQSKCKAFGVFTNNIVKAAPVLVSQKNISNSINAVIVNSGCANACTGKQGLANSNKTLDILSKKFNIKSDNILVASTGIIGKQLDMKKISKGIERLTNNNNVETGQKPVSCDSRSFALSIMTTDTVPKVVSREFKIGSTSVKLTGFAKGAGMIHPNMATMLAFFITDINISKKLQDSAFREIVNDTFNALTVDGDTSTNDCAFILSNGASKNNIIKTKGKSYNIFYEKLKQVAEELVVMMARDGEGATKYIEVGVCGLKKKEDAKKIANTIATSPLVKTAVFGEDPNWGRVLAAAGRAGVNFDPYKVDIKINKHTVVKNGQEKIKNLKGLETSMKKKDIIIEIIFSQGKEASKTYTCDFSYDYIKINADYHT